MHEEGWNLGFRPCGSPNGCGGQVISGRNQLVGLIAKVTISIGSQRITSIISADAILEMRLKSGQNVAALAKSIEVMIIRL